MTTRPDRRPRASLTILPAHQGPTYDDLVRLLEACRADHENTAIMLSMGPPDDDWRASQIRVLQGTIRDIDAALKDRG